MRTTPGLSPAIPHSSWSGGQAAAGIEREASTSLGAARVGRQPAGASGGVWGWLLVVMVLMWFGVGTAGWGAAVPVWVEWPGEGDDGEGREPGWVAGDRVLVRFKPGAAARAAGLAGGLGERLRWVVPRQARRLAGLAGGADVAEALAVVRLEPGTDLVRGLAELGRHPDVLYAEPVPRVQVTVGEGRREAERVPNDFGFPRQWGLMNTGQTGGQAGADIGAPEAWGLTTGSREVVVAIVDTGVDTFHPDLEPNVWTNPGEVPGNGVDDDGNGYVDDVHGYDFVSDDGDPMDDNTHGTHVAGILGAVGDDENGVAGVAWSVRMMALKAFDESGGGTLDDTLAAIAYARRAGARIINASWGTTTRSRALDELVAESVGAGIVFVAAAGNNGSDARFYPAAVPEALAVGASDARDGSPAFSNHGPFVDLVAPGDGIESTMPNAGWTVLSGTSMAAPHVSGVVALMLSRRPEFTPSEVATILRSTADELSSDRFTGAGRLSAARAVAIMEPLPVVRLEVPAVVSGRVDLRGAAREHGLAGYRLEIGAGARPVSWTLLAGGAGPDADGVLMSGFDTARFDDGEYQIRLVASNALGQAAVERTGVTVANVQLVLPANNDVLRHGEAVEVRGTVFGEGRTYEVHWGLGRNPLQWEATGLVAEAGGGVPVVDGVLARWDSGRVPDGAFVTLRLRAKAGDRVVGESMARMVHLDSRLRAGWPRRFGFDDEFPAANWREFNVADLDGDGVQEIVLVDHGEPGGRVPRLLALGPDGAVRWERELPAGAPEHDAPVIGDMDGDGRLEVYVDTGAGGEIAGFDAEGRPLGGGWPVRPGGGHWGKVLADLDGDGRLEMVAVSAPPPDLEGVRRHPLVVIDAEGRVIRRWTVGACDAEAIHQERLAAVGNLDDDPELEIVAVDGCLGVSAFDLGKAEGPIWSVITEANLFASPMVADLDGDGSEEVVIGGVSRGRGLPGGLHVFDREGRSRPGWPVLPEVSFRGGGAIADLDGDGRLEIVIAGWESDTVHVVGADGFELPGWPTLAQVNGYPRSVPVVGDVDGDGALDVVIASPGLWLQVVLGGETARAGGVRAWRADGTGIDLLPGGPPDGLVMEAAAGATWSRMPPAVLTDLDGDGQLDVVAGTVQDRAYSPTPPLARAKMRSSLYAWSLPVPAPPLDAAWAGYQGGAARTGRRVRRLAPNEVPRVVGLRGQTVAPGEVFRPVPLDLYVDDPDGRVDRLVWSAVPGTGLLVVIGADRVARVEVSGPGWVGTSTVEFRVRDVRGGEAVAAVSFEVRPGYRAPVAMSDVGQVEEDGEVELDVLANDHSPTGRALRLGGVSRPGAGTTRVLDSGRVRYRPAPDFQGVDRFEYTLVDDDGGGAIGEVRVEVLGVADAPRPVADRVLLEEDGVVEFGVLGNDLEPDGEALELMFLGQPAWGRLETLGADLHRFTPPPDYHGLQTVLYGVRDSSGLTATGEVVLLVKPVNDPPRARPQTVRLRRNRSVDVIYDTVDPDGDRLTYRVVEGPANGVLLSYPELANYAPRAGFFGTDRFTYTAGDGQTVVGPVEVVLEVEDGNNPPDARPMSTVTAVGQALTVTLEAVDADGDPVTVRVVAPPEHGSVTLEGGDVRYEPEVGFVGFDRFQFVAGDGVMEGEPAEVSIRVTDVNTAPVARSEVLTVARDTASRVELRASDGENNPLTYTVVSNTVFGTLSGEAPGLVYTPRPQFRGVDRFQFRVDDGRLESGVAWVHLLVRDPNRAPVVTNQTLRAVPGRPVTFDLRVTDEDGPGAWAVILKGPRHGRVYGTGLRYTYVPGPEFTGQDTFTYRVWDGIGYSLDATVEVDISGVVDTPPEIVGVRWLAEGVELVVRAPAGRRFRVERSEDLIRWSEVVELDNPGGTVRWVDAVEGVPGGWFYRVRMAVGSVKP